jgi:predicted  nucleic acid-binding Zn-ribbon protein
MEKNDQGQGLGLGEISTIRNILMGQQMNQYEQQFNEMSQRIEQMEARMQEQINQMNQQWTELSEQTGADTNSRFDRLEKILEDGLAKLQARMDKMSKDDKARIGKLLGKVSQQLIGE